MTIKGGAVGELFPCLAVAKVPVFGGPYVISVWPPNRVLMNLSPGAFVLMG